MNDQPIGELFKELAKSNVAYKFGMRGDYAVIRVDGFMKTLAYR
ncbi:MAG: hypothetical protein V1811_01855 [Candidatus Micrarchaeota archaeon]